MRQVYFSLLIFTLFIWTNVFAGDAPVFTNDNLDKYNKQKPMTVREEPKESDSKSDFKDEQKQQKNESDKEYYCKKASELRRKIESTKKGLEAARTESASASGGAVNVAVSVTSSIAPFEAKLKDAELELAALEQEAHEKKIPAGWLRCQY